MTAEGIEREDQLAELRDLGCDRGQGFLFARPMLAADAGRALLAAVAAEATAEAASAAAENADEAAA